jgi:hypothetical protein
MEGVGTGMDAAPLQVLRHARRPLCLQLERLDASLVVPSPQAKNRVAAIILPFYFRSMSVVWWLCIATAIACVALSVVLPWLAQRYGPVRDLSWPGLHQHGGFDHDEDCSSTGTLTIHLRNLLWFANSRLAIVSPAGRIHFGGPKSGRSEPITSSASESDLAFTYTAVRWERGPQTASHALRPYSSRIGGGSRTPTMMPHSR